VRRGPAAFSRRVVSVREQLDRGPRSDAGGKQEQQEREQQQRQRQRTRLRASGTLRLKKGLSNETKRAHRNSRPLRAKSFVSNRCAESQRSNGCTAGQAAAPIVWRLSAAVAIAIEAPGSRYERWQRAIAAACKRKRKRPLARSAANSRAGNERLPNSGRRTSGGNGARAARQRRRRKFDRKETGERMRARADFPRFEEAAAQGGKLLFPIPLPGMIRLRRRARQHAGG
jgi:hypothetical protein